MRFISPLHRDAEYSSVIWRQSSWDRKVSFGIRRPTLGGRLEFAESLRELTLKNEFLQAGPPSDQMSAAIVDLLVRKLYVKWGLAEIRGLTIDGVAASPEKLINSGPEELVDEIVSAIRSESELSEEERKNS